MTTFVRIGLGLVGAAALTAATTPAMAGAGGCASQRQVTAEITAPATATTTKSAKDATPAAPKPATTN